MAELYAMPTRDDEIRLPFPPLVQQWERNDHPAQVRLKAYLDRVQELLGDRTNGDDLALCLSVGRTHIEPLDSDGRDLDNYLQPLAQMIGAAKLSAVFGRKIRSIESAIALTPAQPRADPLGDPHLVIRARGSKDGIEWKEQIHHACADVFREPTAGPVALTIRFGVSARRNWAELWKPAIDALGPMLGMPHPNRFHPRDDRIVALDLHKAVDDRHGDDVLLEMWCTPSAPSPGGDAAAERG
jgi:hypothetical protein